MRFVMHFLLFGLIVVCNLQAASIEDEHARLVEFKLLDHMLRECYKRKLMDNMKGYALKIYDEELPINCLQAEQKMNELILRKSKAAERASIAMDASLFL